MSSSNGRRVAAGALASLALAAGLGVAVRGSASAAENDPHPLVVQRVQNDEGSQLVASVLIADTNSPGDRWCVNLNGGEGSWTDADSSVRVREGHSYNVGGYDDANCSGPGYGQPNSADAHVPVGLSTEKYWLTPNFKV